MPRRRCRSGPAAGWPPAASSLPTASSWRPSPRKACCGCPKRPTDPPHTTFYRPRRQEMKIAITGGGPGGLYFAALMKSLDATHDVTVWERNAPDDTFGFGVVFSDETLGSIEGADRIIHDRMESRFARWTDIDVEFNGRSFTIGGQGFAAMSRKEL